jgi:hypothetical protein
MKTAPVRIPALGSLAGLILLVSACNDNDIPSNAFRISPSEARLARSGDTVTLTAVGGVEPLTWTNLSSMGTLSGSGRTVILTRGSQSGAAIVQVTDKRTWTATATIHLDAETNATATARTLSLSPSSPTLTTDGDRSVFIASGGATPYAWTLADATRGHLSATSGAYVIYTRDTQGNNTVILSDASNTVVATTVTQPDTPATSVADLAITAGQTTLSNDGDITTLTASGGTPPYTWRPAPTMTTGTILHPSNGEHVVYQRDAPGDCAVVVTDSSGDSAIVIISQP